jgi:hypothetical protein
MGNILEIIAVACDECVAVLGFYFGAMKTIMM